MDWETFYERYQDWSESTLLSRISSLKSIGSSAEITEVACSFLPFEASYKLIVKAVKMGAVFSFNDLIELDECDSELTEHILDNCACTLTPTQAAKLEELGYIVPSGCVVQAAAKRRTLKKRADRPVRQKAEVSPAAAFMTLTDPKLDIFGAIFGTKSKGKGKGKGKRRSKAHRCSGDCANCPPHYGYRHGRWYYGHGHTHGCEFGGNKGDVGIES